MKWTVIQKTENAQLESFGYQDPRVKAFLRKEGRLRCVYCAVHENALGGFQAFHVEHYRPKSRFKDLEHKLSNLFYACPICNRFKSNDWPDEPHEEYSNCSYPDPSKVDYTVLFELNQEDGFIEGLYPASKYIIERLYFNRPQLILERRQYFISQKLSTLTGNSRIQIQELKKRGDQQGRQLLAKLAETAIKLNELFIKANSVPLYEASDVSRKRK